jgi:pilus assembly protein CpaC
VPATLCIATPVRADTAERSFVEMVDQVALVPAAQHDSDMLAKATVAVGHIKRLELPQAQLAVNAALQLDARDSQPHFLNGFVYHLAARQGDL